MNIHPEEKQEKLDRFLTVGLLLLALAVAAYFRSFNLKQYPGWYSDEGNHIDLAENWMQGKWENYGVIGAPYSQRPPLYMYTLSVAMRVFGVDIAVTRGVGAFASLVSLGLAAWTAWKAAGRKEAIFTLWVGATAPWIVTFNRLGLTYNLMAPFFLFSLIAIWRYLRNFSTGWLLAAGVSSALAFATDYLGILCGVTILMALLVKRPRAILMYGLVFIAAIFLTILPVLQVNTGVFFADLRDVFFWRGQVQSTSYSLIAILINYSELLRQESWILVGLCGLSLIRDGSLRNILLTAVGLTLLMVTRAYTPVGVGLHYLMHLFPIFALGLGIAILRGFEFVKRFVADQISRLSDRFSKISSPISILAAALIVLTPLVWMFLSSFSMINYGVDHIFTGSNDLRLVDPRSAEEVQAYITSQAASDDLVIGSPVLIWGLPTMNRADFLAALAFNDHTPPNYIIVDKERYTNELTLKKAAYVILDPLAEEFAPLVLPGMSEWLEEIHRWPVVFAAGDIRVYRRP
ncbi:MAG: hypothetical protein GYA15_03920 [Leptolinea sp.]|jgi:4-amino-4-deoxy-L-arabinose transferase-like glycosyltransferase|nr:hypothetical protein [Leptolinea sp.]